MSVMFISINIEILFVKEDSESFKHLNQLVAVMHQIVLYLQETTRRRRKSDCAADKNKGAQMER